MAGDQLRYDGRVAVVTGAGAGLGRAYALLLASRGAKVVVNDLADSSGGLGKSQRAADVVVDEIKALGGTAVADYNSVVDGAKVIESAIKNFGRIDILINNAGILRDRSILKISEADWDLVQDVHLKGSFKTTQAAWPHMKKQNYGRIIMTSSNAGLYGHFGQANYSAAKMGLIGLTNTVALEGAKNNIHCNVIVPSAATRLSKGIFPDILFNEFQPELIAPVVAYMVHESCEDNGVYIESAAGWATKVHTVRGKGVVLRSSLDQSDITPEHVKSVWGRVTDMTGAKHFTSIPEVYDVLIDIVQQLREGKAGGFEDSFEFDFKDLIRYALSVGATVKNSNDMRFLYELNPDFSAIPTFFIVPGTIYAFKEQLIAKGMPSGKVDVTKILHGEQYLEICDDMPTEGTLTTTGKVFDLMDKGSGALVVIQCESYGESGRLLVKNQMSVFVVGAGQFGGHKNPIDGVVSIKPPPQRAPDSSISYKTDENQAAFYRLFGDLNPLHIDPSFAASAGFKTPILHGLCSMGFSVRAVLAQYANNDANLFKAVKARFATPVLPGQTLKVDMWKEGNRIHFRTLVQETGKEVITGAYVDLKDISAKL